LFEQPGCQHARSLGGFRIALKGSALLPRGILIPFVRMRFDQRRTVAASLLAGKVDHRFTAGFLSCFLLLGFPALWAQPEPAAGGELHTVGQPFSVKDGGRLVIFNPHGNVRIRAIPLAASPEFRVVMQTAEGVERPAELRVDALENGVRLAIEPVSAGRLSEEQGFLRADFVVALPDRFALEVEMVDGSFTMHPAGYPVTVRARDARLNLRTTGELDVEITDGHVVVQQGAGDTPLAGGRIQTSGAPVDVLGADIARVTYSTLSGAAVTTDSAALLAARVRDGRAYRFVGKPDNPVLTIQTDHAPIRLVAEGIR
jgi:hypothetical protein